MKSFLITGGAGFIGSNLVLAIQEKYPEAKLLIVDDFRSGNFENLNNYKGDFIASSILNSDWETIKRTNRFDAIFHLASITDTTIHDQQLQVHENVESFRKILQFAREKFIPVIYASSAAVYGHVTNPSKESDTLSPTNSYAFSKMIMDNIAIKVMRKYPEWLIVGLRYFNVYGPNEASKGKSASMICHLGLQIMKGRNPKIYFNGDQARDFVYIKDVIKCTLLALECKKSGIYNVGSGEANSFNQLCAVLAACFSTELKPIYIDNPHTHYQNFTEANLDYTKKNLGYCPDYSLYLGISEYLEKYRNTFYESN
jgi:ADP-L-glycero-D-manno-heptose 6-epimerase